MSNNVTKVVKRGAKTGALIGLFGWFCVFVILVSGSIIVILSNPEYIPDLTRLGLKEILMLFSSNRLFRVLSRISLLILILLPTLPLIVAALGASLSYLAHKIKLDPEGIGWPSLKWAFRSLFTWPGIALLLAIQTLIIVGTIFLNMRYQSWIENKSYQLLAEIALSRLFWMRIASAAFAFFTSSAIPLIVCNTDTVSAPISRSWWKPKWHGWKVVGVFLLIGALNLILTYIYTSIYASIYTVFVLIPIYSSSLLTITLFQASVLLSRSTRITTLAKKIFHRRIIGPWIAYNLFFVLTGIIILIPFLSANLFMSFVFPSIIYFYREQGMPLPLIWHLCNTTFDFVKDYWDSFSLPGILVYWLGVTRLGWKIGLHKLS